MQSLQVVHSGPKFFSNIFILFLEIGGHIWFLTDPMFTFYTHMRAHARTHTHAHAHTHTHTHWHTHTHTHTGTHTHTLAHWHVRLVYIMFFTLNLTRRTARCGCREGGLDQLSLLRELRSAKWCGPVKLAPLLSAKEGGCLIDLANKVKGHDLVLCIITAPSCITSKTPREKVTMLTALESGQSC